MDIKTFLKSHPAFEEFSHGHLEAFAGELEVEDFPDGHVFIREGQQGGALFIILQGVVRVTRRAAEGEEALSELAAGELFGILSLVDDLPAAASCTAKGSVRAAHLDAEAFQRLFHSAQPIARHIQYMIAVQLARDLRQQSAQMRSAMAA